MRLYIILTYDIHGIGGTQSYTWGKSEYLDKLGWDTAVFFPGENTGNSVYSYLNKYIKGGLHYLSYDPSNYTWQTLSIIGEKMLKRYHYCINNYDEIIIETHYNEVALWGEALAALWQCKHVCFICNEYFQPPRKYWDHLPFYKFKYDRRELYGIHKSSMNRLFNGQYNELPKEEEILFHAYYPPNVVQDIWDERMNKLVSADWIIVYFSRAGKGYFKYVMESVATFAEKHTEKTIEFIIISDVDERIEYIKKTFGSCKNIYLQIMGAMSPVPKRLLSDANVVIAGAGCAGWAFRCGAYTLVADAKDISKANGFLGYDTFSTLFAESKGIQKNFDEYLEKLLVEKEYDNLIRKELFKKVDYDTNQLDHRYDEHFELINRSDKTHEYYNVSQPSALLSKKRLDQIKIYLVSNDLLYRIYKIFRNRVLRKK